MWGYYPPAVPRMLKLLCMLQVLGKVKQPAKFQHRTSMHHAVMRINVKNFHGSLTTVVRAQNDTSKTANITDTIFDRTLV